MMEHATKAGTSKMVPACTYPLTGVGCVSRVYTELAVLDITPAGVQVLDMADGLTFDALQVATAVPLLPMEPR